MLHTLRLPSCKILYTVLRCIDTVSKLFTRHFHTLIVIVVTSIICVCVSQAFITRKRAHLTRFRLRQNWLHTRLSCYAPNEMPCEKECCQHHLNAAHGGSFGGACKV